MSLIQSKCIYFKISLYWAGDTAPPHTLPHHFLKLNFTSKILNVKMQINAHQEGTNINSEVNERVLKNIGTHWNKAPLISMSTNFLQPNQMHI